MPSETPKYLFADASGGEPVTLPYGRSKSMVGGDTFEHLLFSSLLLRHHHQQGERGCGLWLICLCYCIPPERIGQGKITHKSPQGWFSSFSHADGKQLTEATKLQSAEIPQWTTQVYSGRVVVTPMSIKDTISPYKPCHPGETEPWETDEKIMSPPANILHLTLTTF